MQVKGKFLQRFMLRHELFVLITCKVLIMFFVYNSKGEKSKAKSAITAAIIGFVVTFVIGILGEL